LVGVADIVDFPIHTIIDGAIEADIGNRYLDQDKSVLPKIFETNAFGLLRIDREYFHQVGKHMTSPVTTIASTSTCNDAMEIFDQNEEIHHLVVLNKSSKPIGVVSQNDLPIPTFDSPAYQIPQGL
jgi:CBS-domain-containing membrane protein